MKTCLIVGQYSAFAGLLIDRFTKEGWRVSTLSESDTPSQKVFEHYKYKYTSEDLVRVINSCRPNLMIYLGAYDNAYRGNNHKDDLKKQYINNVCNLLLYASENGVNHFIYLSSEQVFDNSSIVELTEKMQARPETEHGLLLRQGEMVSLEYNTTANMEVTVLRLANLYCTPHDASDCTDTVTSKCLKAARNEPVPMNTKREYSLLHGKDAVEAVYILAVAEKRRQSVYHIASPMTLTDNELVQVIQSGFVNGISVSDATKSLSSRRVLDADAFNREFNFHYRVDYQKAVPEIVSTMQSNLARYVGDDGAKARKSTFWHTVFSVAEVVVLVFLCYLAKTTFGGNDVLGSIDLYLLVTLMFGAYYGSKHGVLSAALSTFFYFLGETGRRSGLEVLVDIKVYVWIAQIFIVALAVGYVRDTLLKERTDSKIRDDYYKERLDDLSKINNSNVRIKDFYEERLLDSNESVGYIYNIISMLDTANQNYVMFEATKIMMRLMETNDVSIYRIHDNGYFRVITSTSDRSRSLGKSIKKEDYAYMMDQIETKRMYVNRQLDARLPSMVGSLTNADNEVEFIVMLWDIKYTHMTLYHRNLMNVICKLISSAFLRAADYLDVTRHFRTIENTNILAQQAFDEILELYMTASREHLTEYCLLRVETAGMTPTQMDASMKGLIRFTDSMGIAEDGNLYVLLTNTNHLDAQFVINRLEKKGLKSNIFNTDNGEG